MLVSHTNKFIFIKVNCTASTSIEYYLEKFCMPEGDWKPYSPPRRDMYTSDTGIIGARHTNSQLETWYGPQPALMIKTQLGDAFWDGYTKICSVRNPYDMAVTAFYQEKRNDALPIGTLEEEKAEFLQWLEAGGFRGFWANISIDGGKFGVDHIIKYESLHFDLERICTELDIPYVPEELLSWRADWRPAEFNSQTMYTDAGKEIVRVTCERELEAFGYEFPTESAKHLPL